MVSFAEATLKLSLHYDLFVIVFYHFVDTVFACCLMATVKVNWTSVINVEKKLAKCAYKGLVGKVVHMILFY